MENNRQKAHRFLPHHDRANVADMRHHYGDSIEVMVYASDKTSKTKAIFQKIILKESLALSVSAVSITSFLTLF